MLKVVHRFVTEGEAGLRDHREDNGYPKVNDELREALVALVHGSPEDYGWARPTWTQELLTRQLAHETQVRVSASTPDPSRSRFMRVPICGQGGGRWCSMGSQARNRRANNE